MIAVALGGLLACSCTDREDEFLYQDLGTKKVVVSPNNTENPYDWVGVKHNIHLDEISSILFEEYDNPNNLELSIVTSLTKEHLSELYDNTLVEPIINNGLYRCETEAELSEVLKNDIFSNTSEAYINSILSSIENLKNDSYMSYKAYISEMESRIVTDNKIQEVEKVVLLSFTSTLRHSIYYWYEPETSAKVKCKWLKIALADGKGALASGAQGAAIGAIAGTGGAVIGASTGALIGAVAASIEKAEQLDSIKEPVDDKPIEEPKPEIQN